MLAKTVLRNALCQMLTPNLSPAFDLSDFYYPYMDRIIEISEY